MTIDPLTPTAAIWVQL